jgi:hypothetical protein
MHGNKKNMALKPAAFCLACSFLAPVASDARELPRKRRQTKALPELPEATRDQTVENSFRRTIVREHHETSNFAFDERPDRFNQMLNKRIQFSSLAWPDTDDMISWAMRYFPEDAKSTARRSEVKHGQDDPGPS